jgi:hypothetical protein
MPNFLPAGRLGFGISQCDETLRYVQGDWDLTESSQYNIRADVVVFFWESDK